jgi:phage I-like protein
MPSEEEIYGAIARGWCDERNSGKEMDVDLADAIAIEVLAVVRPRIATLERQVEQAREALERVPDWEQDETTGRILVKPEHWAQFLSERDDALQALREGGENA